MLNNTQCVALCLLCSLLAVYLQPIFPLHLLVKTIASLCFVRLGWINANHKSWADRLVLVGLLFSLGGDVTLAVNRVMAQDVVFQIGGFLFLITHAYVVILLYFYKFVVCTLSTLWHCSRRESCPHLPHMLNYPLALPLFPL